MKTFTGVVSKDGAILFGSGFTVVENNGYLYITIETSLIDNNVFVPFITPGGTITSWGSGSGSLQFTVLPEAGYSAFGFAIMQVN